MKTGFFKIIPLLVSSLIFVACNQADTPSTTEQINDSTDQVENNRSFGDLISDLGKKENNPIQPIPSASSQIVDTSNWKTYDEGVGFSFLYPPDLIADEKDLDFTIFTKAEDMDMTGIGISLDARKENSTSNYETAINSYQENLSDLKTEEIKGGVKISGKISSGFGQGSTIYIAILKYDDGALVFQTTDQEPYKNYFDKIISTIVFE